MLLCKFFEEHNISSNAAQRLNNMGITWSFMANVLVIFIWYQNTHPATL